MLPRISVICLLLASVAGNAAAGEIGLVAQINGAPTLLRNGQSIPLTRAATLQPGDEISTDEAAKAKLLLADDSVLTIGPRTRVRLDELELGKTRKGRLSVLIGRFKFAVAKYFDGPTDYEIDTPTAVAGVRGTVLWGDTERDTICALDGRIKVRARTAKETASVAEGHCVTGMGRGSATPATPSAPDLAAYLKEVTLQ